MSTVSVLFVPLSLGCLLFQGKSFSIPKNSIPSCVPRRISKSCLSSMQSNAKAELINYILSNIKQGEAFEESIASKSVGSNIESKITELTTTQSKDTIKHYFEGE